MKNKGLVLVLLLVTVIIAAYLYSQRLINSYSYKVSNILFNEFSLSKIQGTLKVSIFNLKTPNFVIQKLILKIYVNDVFIDEVKQLNPTESNTGNIDINLDFNVKPKELLKLQSLNLVLLKDKTIKYSGYAVIHKFFDFKIPIEYKFSM